MKKSFSVFGLCLVAVLLVSLPAGKHGNIYPQTPRPGGGTGGDTPITRNTFIQIAQRVTPSIVNVWNMAEEGIFKTQVKSGGGTGFIIDSKKGILLTNNHVVSGAKGLMITMNDKRVFKAKVIGTDSFCDVAVVQIENPPPDLKQVTLGNSDKVMPGEWVIAIGQPLFMDYTVTTGIVCAVGRGIEQIGRTKITTMEYTKTFLQITAEINPGNSGGPLFNLSGEVIGINTLKDLRAAYAYSIPINIALDIKDKILKEGHVIRAYFGINGTDIDDILAMNYNTTVEELVKDLGLKGPNGVFLLGTTEGSPAESVGFEEGDIMIEFDGKKTNNMKDFRTIMEKLKPGQEIQMKYIRKKEEKTATVKLAELGGGKKTEQKKPAEEEEDE